MSKRTGRRVFATASAAALAVSMLVAPASATPDDGDGHKVTICHVTNSETNTFVIIEVDVAAFDGEGANDHSQHITKDEQHKDEWVPDGTTDTAACLGGSSSSDT